MKIKCKLNRKAGLLLIISVGIIGSAVIPTQGQVYRKSNYSHKSSHAVVAIQSGLGTRSFAVKSDIDYLNGNRSTLEGWESSLLVGGKMVRLRSGFGAYKTNKTKSRDIKQASVSGLVNLYALNMLGKAHKYFHPYATVGIDVNTLQFTGTEIPAVASIFSNPNLTPCELLAPRPPLPDTGVTNSAKMTSTQLIGGAGLELSFVKDGYFFSMFGEARYGHPVGTTTQTQVLNNTYVHENIALVFGIALGIGK
jgi:hypothetical protein